ncbi:MAG: acyl-CoA dehydrogenase family protein [Dehalococcoidales bacterium]|jgi:acyl-CoA dehydrogenase
MDFELSEELKMIQSLARDFVEGQLKPLERDLLGRAADLADARAYLPPEQEAALVKMARELGLWGVGVPEELGGAGLSALGVCLVEEELAKTIVPFHFGDITPVLFDCSPEQREKYLTPALAGEIHPCLALVEEGVADPSRLTARAVKSDGHYILNGTKLSYSRRYDRCFAVVFAAAEKGITCFMVEKDTPGFSIGAVEERSGWLSQLKAPLALTFQDCRVPESDRLGAEGQAFHLGKKWLPPRRIVRGARCVGIASRLLEESSVRAQSTETFGQSIQGRPGVQAALAEIAVNIHAARLMVYDAAAKADAGQSIFREAAMVRLFTTRLVRAAADQAAHIFNGPPYIDGLSVERLCRRALDIGLSEIALDRQRHIVAADVLKGLKV